MNSRSVLRVFLAIFALGMLGSSIVSPVTTIAQSDLDAQNAANAAYMYSVFESTGDYNSEYDFIHPDARAVIPRAAVTGWYLDNYWPRQPQPITVTGVRFVSWTWPVTGVTYPNTAEVTFTQVFLDGGENTIENDVVRLVQDRNGTWRWFFGRSREFVDEVIAQYAPQPPTTSYTGSALIDETASDLDAYWTSFFTAAPVSYSTPSVVTFDQDVWTGCGISDPFTSGAHYCAADRTIYLNVFQLEYVESQYSGFTVQLVLAHEWGHHVQNTLGLLAGQQSANIELQADCLAGAWARDLATRYNISENELIEAMSLFISIGDPTHGQGTLRSKELLDGFYDGSQACFGR